MTTETLLSERFDELMTDLMGPGASRLYRADGDAAASVTTTTAPTGATETTTTDPEHSRDQPETTNPTKGGPHAAR